MYSLSAPVCVLLTAARATPRRPPARRLHGPSCPSAPASGDVNGDGKLTIADVAAALLHQQSLQGTGQAPPCALAAADLDADGELGGADVEALRKLVVGE